MSSKKKGGGSHFLHNCSQLAHVTKRSPQNHRSLRSQDEAQALGHLLGFVVISEKWPQFMDLPDSVTSKRCYFYESLRLRTSNLNVTKWTGRTHHFDYLRFLPSSVLPGKNVLRQNHTTKQSAHARAGHGTDFDHGVLIHDVTCFPKPNNDRLRSCQHGPSYNSLRQACLLSRQQHRTHDRTTRAHVLLWRYH